MSRIAKWKLEKTKVKVVFRLQFHATHIPQSGWDKLYISFIPSDSGKATAKTTKANVRNGTCKWGDPIYETTRLLQDSKTKQYDEKSYKLVVAMGSSRSSILGETNINLADYVDALKPYATALPLNGCESGTILHVTVQLLTSKTGFREFEQQRELREGRVQTSPDQNSHDGSQGRKVSYSEENVNHQTDTRVRFREGSKELPLHEEQVRLNEECADSAAAFEGSSYTSESLYAEKHETSSTHENESVKSTISGDLGGLSLGQSPGTEKGDHSDHQFPLRGTNDWPHGWGSDYSAANNLALAYEENSRLRESLEVSESSINELKLELSSIQNYADDLGVETQKIAQQLNTEIASGQELTKEVWGLKSECLKLKDGLGSLTNSKSSLALAEKIINETDQDHLIQDFELKWLNGLSVIEEKVRDLQKKTCFGFQDRDLRFLSSDIETLLCCLQDLKQGMGLEISGLHLSSLKEVGKMKSPKDQLLVSGISPDADMYQSENMLHYIIPGLVSHAPQSIDAINAMKGKIFELLRELDNSKAEREGLVRKMDQMECYYEALIQELEENQKQMMGELQNLRNEHAMCLYTMATSKAEMEALHHDMNKQLIRFAEDKRDLDSLNKELESRAMGAEAALRRARLNYSIAVNQLQKDLEMLSSQVTSMFETNENLIRQAVADSSTLSCHQSYSDTGAVELEDLSAAQLLQCQNNGAKKYQLSGGIFSEDLKRSLHLQEGIYRKVEDEVCEVHLMNIYFDVFSVTLQETLLEARIDARLMKEEMIDLSQQLELSTKSEELMMRKLETALGEVHSLNNDKDCYISKSKEMALQIASLEANLKSATLENCLLTEKNTDYETLATEYRSFEEKYHVCSAEKLVLESSLKKEAFENNIFQVEISSLRDELKALRNGFDGLASEKENLQNLISLLHEKLRSLLASYYNSYKELSLFSEPIYEDLEPQNLVGFAVQLEGLHHNACEKILQLMKEKKSLLEERNVAQMSLSKAESDNVIMREKFEHEICGMMGRLDLANALMQKLQSKTEVVSDRLTGNCAAEEKLMQQHEELLVDLDRLEGELQELTSRNKDLAQEMMVLGSVSEELRSCKLTVGVSTKEKEALTGCLLEKTEELTRLKLEFDNVKESMQTVYDELLVERSLRDGLDSRVKDLNSKLDEKGCQLLRFDQVKAEVVQLKQLISDLELEKSGLRHCLSQSEECLKNTLQQSSSRTCQETQLLEELYEFSVAADVGLIFTRTQYEAFIDHLPLQLHSSDSHLNELQKKHLNVDALLDCCLASEACHIEEGARLLTSFNALKSELEAVATENRVLLDSNRNMMTEFEDFKNRTESMEANYNADRIEQALEVERLEKMLATYEHEIDNLILSWEELEVKLLVLNTKLEEQSQHMSFQEGCNYELVVLQSKCNELTQRLSEQVLKTEEYKNLSIHLKELKDKAASECLQPNEKREHEGSPSPIQESLRIAFIKEQYETKLQELKLQLSISKKHSEEMLWKLQDVIDEVENRKKLEASQLKRNQELASKILELEDVLNSLLSEKREIVKAYDLMKAEKECSSISLECCKEEKLELETSLQKCNEEKLKITMELNLMKDFLEASNCPTDVRGVGSDGIDKVHSISDWLISRKLGLNNEISERISEDMFSQNGLIKDQIRGFSDQNNACIGEEAQHASTDPIDETNNSVSLLSEQTQTKKDLVVSRGGNGLPGLTLVNQDTEHIALVNVHFRSHTLKSSLDLLNKELERMKNENSFIAHDDHHFDSYFPGLQRELMRLHKANEELGNIFPLFKDFSFSGNALERVLALEIELAEALQAKKRPTIHFQSSFLKQHSDEEAIFRSFRDINELIKDMLDLKGRYTNVEAELKEMHNRYSQLSLQFAEVEGERQKLMMTLKNVRASRKNQTLNRSSSASLGEQTP